MPPHAPGVAVKVEGLDVPLIKHPPLRPLLNVIVLDAGTAPQATVTSGGLSLLAGPQGLLLSSWIPMLRFFHTRLLLSRFL